MHGPRGIWLTPFSLTEYECWNQAGAHKKEVVSVRRIVLGPHAVIILVETLATFSHSLRANIAFTARSPRCGLIAIFRTKDIVVLEKWRIPQTLREIA